MVLSKNTEPSMVLLIKFWTMTGYLSDMQNQKGFVGWFRTLQGSACWFLNHIGFSVLLNRAEKDLSRKTEPYRVLLINAEPHKIVYWKILNRKGSVSHCWTITDFLFDYVKLKRFFPMIRNMKRFCLIVLSYIKISCSAEFLSLSVDIRRANRFERE